jgi:hypothetical protein
MVFRGSFGFGGWKKGVLWGVGLGSVLAWATACWAGITTFTGGDPGEGLSFSGNYLYAVNVNGPGGDTVQGLTFTAESTTKGIQITSTDRTSRTVTYGYPSPTPNDTALGNIMSRIRFSYAPSTVELTYNVLPGRTYQLQLLLDCSAYNARTQDIMVDGVTVADNLALPGPPPINPTSYLVTHTYTATSNQTVVRLGPSGMVGGNGVGGDNNAVLNAFVVKELPDTTIGYWRFDDAQPGTTPTTVASIYNNGVMQGTVGGQPVISSDVPSYWIQEGIGGPVRPMNTTSIYFDPAGGNDYVTIPFSPLTQPSEFTIEFFMKANAQGVWPGIVQKRKILPSENPNSTATGSGNITWGIGKDPGEREFARIDPASGAANQTFTISGNTADGKWHHFALTYSNGTWTMYQDYTKVNQRTGLLIDYDGLSGLSFGWAQTDFYAYRGWLDEVRFSNRVLTPAEFLQMVPEPSSGLLALLGLAAFTLYVRLRKKVTL